MKRWAMAVAVAVAALDGVGMTAAARAPETGTKADGAPLAVLSLTPDTYTAHSGDRLAVRAVASDAGASRQIPWSAIQFDWLCVRSGGSQENVHALDPMPADGQPMLIPLSSPGVAMIGLDAHPAVVEVPRADLESFLRAHLTPEEAAAIKKALPAGERPVRVRRVESAKLLVRVSPDPPGTPDLNSATAASKSGQAVEIRALADPTTLPVGADLPLRFYADGRAAPGARYIATTVNGAGKTQTVEGVADSSGIGHLTVSNGGVWWVEFHAVTTPPAQPAGAPPQADQPDLILHSATLTFAVPSAPGVPNGRAPAKEGRP